MVDLSFSVDKHFLKDEAGASSPHRPHPVVDPSIYTHTDVPHGAGHGGRAGSVVRSNSLRLVENDILGRVH